MRGKTLDNLIEAVRAECRLSTDNSRGLENREYLIQVIKRNYEVLYGDYDWPHLAIRREECFVETAAGQRYYDWPDLLDVDTIVGAYHKYGNVWVPLNYGINLSTYNMIDSEADIRADPISRWQIRDEDQFEVWPIPITDGNLVGFSGKRKFEPLVKGSDRILIDDIVVVLFCAAEILAALKSEDAKRKMDMASARLLKLRARINEHGRTIVGGVDPLNSKGAGWPRLRVVYAR
jgi:hypothetical protein